MSFYVFLLYSVGALALVLNNSTRIKVLKFCHKHLNKEHLFIALISYIIGVVFAYYDFKSYRAQSTYNSVVKSIKQGKFKDAAEKIPSSLLKQSGKYSIRLARLKNDLANISSESFYKENIIKMNTEL